MAFVATLFVQLINTVQLRLRLKLITSIRFEVAARLAPECSNMDSVAGFWPSNDQGAKKISPCEFWLSLNPLTCESRSVGHIQSEATFHFAVAFRTEHHCCSHLVSLLSERVSIQTQFEAVQIKFTEPEVHKHFLSEHLPCFFFCKSPEFSFHDHIKRKNPTLMPHNNGFSSPKQPVPEHEHPIPKFVIRFIEAPTPWETPLNGDGNDSTRRIGFGRCGN